ncbi:V-set domain-containing T-cell activation inhibitor 1-like [Cyclopterus lumpus]|uniref:V-set domain-containing T-cell activation inhibitor 1-like n=1 Tax=Cyclopterus lumpus TaxID=8103 RepID=UPI001486C36F|nr:V-set domain-containing T-cell activation inhibitor 1-like [Cyclopterus lumpus]
MALWIRAVFLGFLTFVRTVNGEDAVDCVLGGSCILPCSFPPGGEVVLYWIQVATGNTIHYFYNNQDQVELQDQHFRGRTSLFKDQISRGNASLRLTGVQIQDQGRYRCYTSNKPGTKESFSNLNVYAPVRKVDIRQLENRITCSSEGIYPEPTLTWTTKPPFNETLQNQTTVQQTEQQLYSISSFLVASAPGLDYSCTVSTRVSQRRATWSLPTNISGSRTETTIRCRSSEGPPTGLIWRFNHSQIILNQTGTDYTTSEDWKKHVKSSSESGILTLKDLSSSQEGIYSCELSDAEETYSSFFLRLEGSPDSHNNVAEIAGWVIVVFVVCGLIAAAIFKLKYKKRKKNSQPNGQTSEEHEMNPLNGQKTEEDK